MSRRFPHDQLCHLVELEPTPEQEWSELYRTWKQEELKDLWLELKRIEDTYLRRLKNRKSYVERTLGIRLNVRIPRTVVQPPATISRLIDPLR